MKELSRASVSDEQMKRILSAVRARIAELDPMRYFAHPDQFSEPAGIGSKEIRVSYMLTGSGACVRQDNLIFSLTRPLRQNETINRLVKLDDGRIYTAEECGVDPAELAAPTVTDAPGYAVFYTLADLFRAAPEHEVVYGLCQTGACMVFRSGNRAVVQTGIREVPGLPTPVLNALVWKVPQPPRSLLKQFQWGAQQFDRSPGTEVGAIFLWNLREERWELVVPYQTVRPWTFTWYAQAGSSSPLSTPEYVDPNYVFGGVIHSHRTAPAFESSVDRANLHGPMDLGFSVIMGRVHDKVPDIKFFVISEGEKVCELSGIPDCFVDTGEEPEPLPAEAWARASTQAPTAEIDQQLRLQSGTEGEAAGAMLDIPSTTTRGWSGHDDIPLITPRGWSAYGDREIPNMLPATGKRITRRSAAKWDSGSTDLGADEKLPLDKLSDWDLQAVRRFRLWLSDTAAFCTGSKRHAAYLAALVLAAEYGDEVRSALECLSAQSAKSNKDKDSSTATRRARVKE